MTLCVKILTENIYQIVCVYHLVVLKSLSMCLCNIKWVFITHLWVKSSPFLHSLARDFGRLTRETRVKGLFHWLLRRYLVLPLLGLNKHQRLLVWLSKLRVELRVLTGLGILFTPSLQKELGVICLVLKRGILDLIDLYYTSFALILSHVGCFCVYY